MLRVFKFYMNHHVSQSQAAKHLTEGEIITVQEMASMGDRLKEMVAKEKEKKQRAKDQRSLEMEKEGIQRKLERRLVEEEGHGNQNKN